MAAALAPQRKLSKPLAIVAARIVQEALREDVELATLSRLAESDPGFGLRVVAAVNSGAFGLSRKVSDVKQAAMLLGIRGLRNLALGLVVSDMIPTGAEGTILLLNSLRRAVVARLLAEAMGSQKLDEFFTTGLFLEIGLLQNARSDLAGSADVARMPALYRPTYERACGKIDHPTSGAELARQLRLPDAMIEAVALHHGKEPPAHQLGRVAWAAERIAGVFEGGDAAKGRLDALEAAKLIGVTAAQGADLLDRVPELVSAAASAFDRTVPPQEKLDALVADANRRLVEMNNGYERLLRQLETLLAEKDELATQLGRANEERASVAATDSLTGLPNRRAFEEALKRDLARAQRANGKLSLLMVDVDFFKKVNDTYGHTTGDVVLKEVANVLRAALRTGDVPARLGGEEFVALLPGSDAEGGRIVAERIRTTLASTKMQGPKGTFVVTASFGVASCTGESCKAAETSILDRADAALYEAKRTGRNRVVLSK